MTERSHTAEQSFRVRVKEGEFPTDPEKRFEAVFAAIGNSEAKCLTLLCLSDTLVTKQELWRRFNELSENAWVASRSVQATYCRASLIPIGLVAEESFVRQGTSNLAVGFRLTEMGKKYGVPVAAFLLEKSVGLLASLDEIFGKTGSSSFVRSVVTRTKILEYLYEQTTTVRRNDIADSLGMLKESVSGHLKKLNEIGLVDYASVNFEKKGHVTYKLDDNAFREQVETVGSEASITKEIADLIFELGEVNGDIIFVAIRNKHANANEQSLRNRINNTLSGLSAQGICKRTQFKGAEIHSEASLTEVGRSLVSTVIYPIKVALANSDVLDGWRRINWQEHARYAVTRHKESSGHANWHPEEERMAEILEAIRIQDSGIRPNELESLLGYDPVNFLRSLINKGFVVKEKKGKAVRYRAVPTQIVSE